MRTPSSLQPRASVSFIPVITVCQALHTCTPTLQPHNNFRMFCEWNNIMQGSFITDFQNLQNLLWEWCITFSPFRSLPLSWQQIDGDAFLPCSAIQAIVVFNLLEVLPHTCLKTLSDSLYNPALSYSIRTMQLTSCTKWSNKRNFLGFIPDFWYRPNVSLLSHLKSFTFSDNIFKLCSAQPGVHRFL